MPLSQRSALLEGLLLVAPQGVTVAGLARAAGATPAEITAALAELDAHLLAEGHGLRLLRAGDGPATEVRLVAAPEHAACIGRFLGTADAHRLTPAAMETLAVIAYRQPVTRAEIEEIRGVNCDAVLNTLIARDLVADAGRADTVGRPLLYAT